MITCELPVKLQNYFDEANIRGLYRLEIIKRINFKKDNRTSTFEHRSCVSFA